MLKKGFTLIEMLIVIGIISILVALESFVYVNSQRSARDGKRKADLENIRAALEQYRSANDSYPMTSKITFKSSCVVNDSLNDGVNIYMDPLPSDPFCQLYKYYYSSSPSDCDEGITKVCNDYKLGTYLEKATTRCTGGMICIYATSQACNYCVGPYGTK